MRTASMYNRVKYLYGVGKGLRDLAARRRAIVPSLDGPRDFNAFLQRGIA